ncbi:MAG TPA: hypothetical protein VFT39_02695 [Vicinamibacterales bacterium]|nr:hypothetical protein [Vicinamibacterales bacterium]
MERRQARWIVAVGIAVLWITHTAGQAVRRNHGFVFSAGTCEGLAADCQIREPKEWTDAEASVVSAALDAIAATPLGRLVLDRVALQGVTTLRRFRTGAPGPRDDLGVGSTAQFDRTSPAHAIDIHDLYFSYRGVRDRFSGQPGYLQTAEILLHECFHVLDDGTGSLAMARLAGFNRSATGWHFSILTTEDALVFNTMSAADKQLRAGDRSVDVLRLDRSLALKLRPTRVPSLRATRNPAEAFAEIGAHLVLDPRARRYLPADIVSYFDRQIFVRRTRHGA